MQKIVIAVLTFVLFIGASCATIMNGPSQEIGVSSNPSGAKIYVNGQPKGTTPGFVDLKRRSTYTVKVELEGYMPYETTITRKVSGWVLGNILFGGIIGLVVDAVSGSLFTLSPEQIQAELHKQGAHRLPDSGVYIAVTMKPDPRWKKIGTLEKQHE